MYQHSNKASPSLRESIASDELPLEQFNKMKIEEMPEERRAADREIKEENSFKTLGAGEQTAEIETWGFRCGRCKQYTKCKCYYREVQTPRSANLDEPKTTTFVICANCGRGSRLKLS